MSVQEQETPRRTLRDIVSELLDALDASEGEVTPEIEALFNSVHNKAEAYAAVIRHYEHEAAAFEELAHAYKVRCATKLEQGERLRTRLLSEMDRIGVTKLKTPTATISVRETQSVEISDPELFCYQHEDSDFVRARVEPDKRAIKGCLERGEEVLFAALTTKRSVQLRMP